MDENTVKHLWALREVNKALIDGLKAAAYVLEHIEEISKKQRDSMVETIKELIAQSEEVYGEEVTKH
jgi:hypothetical protein